MNKKELRKLKAGMWLEVAWKDSPNTVVLLMEKPDAEERGDISLWCMHETTYLGKRRELNGKRDLYTNWHVVHTQVVRVVGEIQFPSLGDKMTPEQEDAYDKAMGKINLK